MSEREIKCGGCKGHHATVAEVRACCLGRPAQEAQAAPTEPGFYQAGTKVYRLAQDGSWALLGPDGRFYAGAARAPYRPERMTREEVAAKGRILIRCLVCGRKLTRPESRAAGMGDVCSSRF
jgi:hypothetical protein